MNHNDTTKNNDEATVHVLEEADTDMGEDPNVLEGTMKVTTPKFKTSTDDDEENANIAETLAGLHDADVEFIPTTITEEESKEISAVPVVIVSQDEIVLIEA
jgi:hypothetical protein